MASGASAHPEMKGLLRRGLKRILKWSMPHLILCCLAAAASFSILLDAQATPARPAVPKETLPPILTPWEAAAPRTREANNSAFPAHRVIGNVYYVGTADYASFLITSDQGHILINPDFEDSVP